MYCLSGNCFIAPLYAACRVTRAPAFGQFQRGYGLATSFFVCRIFPTLQPYNLQQRPRIYARPFQRPLPGEYSWHREKRAPLLAVQFAIACLTRAVVAGTYSTKVPIDIYLPRKKYERISG